jgi:hypothetical protein
VHLSTPLVRPFSQTALPPSLSLPPQKRWAENRMTQMSCRLKPKQTATGDGSIENNVRCLIATLIWTRWRNALLRGVRGDPLYSFTSWAPVLTQNSRWKLSEMREDAIQKRRNPSRRKNGQGTPPERRSRCLIWPLWKISSGSRPACSGESIC